MHDQTIALPELLKYRDLATLLNRTVDSIRNDVKHRRIPPPIRLGGSVRWRKATIREWLEKDCPSVSCG